jgi:cytochrome c553
VSQESTTMMLRTLTAALLLAASPLLLAQGNVEAGRTKAQVCQACHGVDGNGVGDGQYPLIANQHADYLVKSLKDYRSGVRPNPIMAGFSAALSDQDIADLAAYFASQPGRLRDLREMR